MEKEHIKRSIGRFHHAYDPANVLLYPIIIDKNLLIWKKSRKLNLSFSSHLSHSTCRSLKSQNFFNENTKSANFSSTKTQNYHEGYLYINQQNSILTSWSFRIAENLGANNNNNLKQQPSSCISLLETLQAKSS